MHPEIENLINMALADGEVTEKERAIILRKAESLGEDKDEIEMILDGKIALMKKAQVAVDAQQQIPKSNKEGDLRKCPSCGAMVVSFQSKCESCGHEFRNVGANRSIVQLFNSLTKAAEDIRIQKAKEAEVQSKAKWYQANAMASNPWFINQAITNEQIGIINSFPIPNTKEDIIEFLAQALPLAIMDIKKIGNFMYKVTLPEDTEKEKLKTAWLAKCQQIIIKARFLLKDDINTLNDIEYYAKQLGIK